MMSKSEQSRVNDLERRVKALEELVGQIDGKLMAEEFGADHKAHVAAFPKKTLTLKAKQ